VPVDPAEVRRFQPFGPAGVGRKGGLVRPRSRSRGSIRAQMHRFIHRILRAGGVIRYDPVSWSLTFPEGLRDPVEGGLEYGMESPVWALKWLGPREFLPGSRVALEVLSDRESGS